MKLSDDLAPSLEPLRATYSSKLKTAFCGWRVLAEGEIALILPEDCCCDMRGAIEIAEKVMPSVFIIEVFAGGRPDIRYVNSLGRWSAFDYGTR